MARIPKSLKAELSFENILRMALKTPGVKVNRAKFLKKELIRYYPETVIVQAIAENPAQAGISKEIISMVSKKVIQYDTTKVTGISVVASLPGGVATVGAATADITSYFAFVLRAVQELAYLYGFPQFDLTDDDDLDSETMQLVLVFLGVMFGVQGAASVLQKIANSLAKQIAKKLAQKTLTKGAIYPIVKKVAIAVGVRMTKQIFADSIASTVPILGSIASGGLTYAMFKPGCIKLRKHLMSYNLCDPEFYKNNADSEEVIIDGEVVDAEIIDVEIIDDVVDDDVIDDEDTDADGTDAEANDAEFIDAEIIDDPMASETGEE